MDCKRINIENKAVEAMLLQGINNFTEFKFLVFKKKYSKLFYLLK